MKSKEIGAFAYRIEQGRVYVVLVTNRDRTRWILPKGQPEFRLSDKKVALLEAYEEAGVRGKIDKNVRREKIRVHGSRGDVTMKIYPIKLHRLMTDWPESRVRKRVLITVDKALLKVTKKSLQRCIKALSKKVLEQARDGDRL